MESIKCTTGRFACCAGCSDFDVIGMFESISRSVDVARRYAEHSAKLRRRCEDIFG